MEAESEKETQTPADSSAVAQLSFEKKNPMYALFYGQVLRIMIEKILCMSYFFKTR